MMLFNHVDKDEVRDISELFEALDHNKNGLVDADDIVSHVAKTRVAKHHATSMLSFPMEAQDEQLEPADRRGRRLGVGERLERDRLHARADRAGPSRLCRPARGLRCRAGPRGRPLRQHDGVASSNRSTTAGRLSWSEKLRRRGSFDG